MAQKIVGYRGLGNDSKTILIGHAFEKHKLIDTHPRHDRVHNFKQSIRRFRLKPLKLAEVNIKINGNIYQTQADKYGYFHCEVNEATTSHGWNPYQIKLDSTKKWRHFEYYRPKSNNSTAVISDIDDTLLISHSTKLIRKVRLIMFKNAYTRKTTGLLKRMYMHWNDIEKGLVPEDYFFVSNSEWNLYDFLVDFFDHNELPKGVFLLQNLKRGLRDLLGSGKVNNNHKLESIQFLFSFFEQKDFVLIGDNGQKDLDIYHKIARKYPERVKGIIIRRLPYRKDQSRINQFSEIFDQLKVPFITFH